MRIGLLTPVFLPSIGGAEINADLLARGLIARGHDLRVLTQRTGRGPADVPYPVTYYRRLPKMNLWPEALAWPIWKLHRRWPFQVMLSFYSYPTGYAASLLKRRLGFGLVLSPRGGDLHDSFHASRALRMQRTILTGYRNADHIVSISQSLIDRLASQIDPLPPHEVAYNGVDLDLYHPRHHRDRPPPPGLPVARPFILHLASVKPIKNHRLAIQAVHRLAPLFRQRAMRYVIAGAGPDAQALQHDIDRQGLSDIVQLIGPRLAADKHWLLSNAHCLLTTSIEEGLGTVLVEAIASSLPILASDIPAHRELVASCGCGLLFASNDPDALIAQMRTMIESDPQPWRDAAFAHRHRFGIDAMIDAYERACARVSPDRPGRTQSP